MAMNRIQFQPGMSLPEFNRSFGTEAQCEQALMAARWPAGWRCSRCDHDAHYKLARQSQANRDLLKTHKLRDGIARRAKPGQQARQRLDARNKTLSRSRARVEHVFAGLEQLGGKAVRAMTLARNELALLLKCAAYNAKRLVWLMSQGSTAGAR